MEAFRRTSWQRRCLRSQLRHTLDARVCRRTLAVLEVDRGRSIAQVAQMLGVTRQSVYNWLASYGTAHDAAALVDAPRGGRPRLWTEESASFL